MDPRIKILYIVFLPVILLLGFVTSYEDFRTSRIRNKWVLAGLIYALFVYLASWFIYFMNNYQAVPEALSAVSKFLTWNFSRFCINLAICTVASYLLWRYKMWGAGDAKLFIAYAALTPLAKYPRVYFDYYFASFYLLMAIFIPATLFLLFKSAIYFIKRFDYKEIRKNFSLLLMKKLKGFKIKDAVKIVFGFFVFFLFFSILREGFNSLLSRFISKQYILILVALLLFGQLSNIFKKNLRTTVMIFVSLMVYFFWRFAHSGSGFIPEMRFASSRVFLIMVLFPIARRIIEMYIERTTQKTTPFAFWMFLGALAAWFI